MGSILGRVATKMHGNGSCSLQPCVRKGVRGLEEDVKDEYKKNVICIVSNAFVAVCTYTEERISHYIAMSP